MTRLLAILIALAFVLGYIAGKRTGKPCPEAVPDEDRLGYAGLQDRVSRYDRDFDAKKRLERK